MIFCTLIVAIAILGIAIVGGLTKEALIALLALYVVYSIVMVLFFDNGCDRDILNWIKEWRRRR